MIDSIKTRTGAEMKRLGLGTWKMGERSAWRKEEADALRHGMDLGMTLIDTAEMYADAELVVADAIQDRRDELFIVSKVLPSNASRGGTIEAANRSLERLGTDRIDLYLLHWAGEHPLEETLAGFRQLKLEGKILHYGVSNFDTAEMESAEAMAGGNEIASNQILYNLRRRGPERSLIPWCTARDVVVMAYSPLNRGPMPWGGALAEVARRNGLTEAQTALAWVLRTDGVIAIPKATAIDHVTENAAALDVRLSDQDLERLDASYPAPRREVPLETA